VADVLDVLGQAERVVFPRVWTTIVMVPFFRSKSATVSGIRSEPSWRRSMTK
jgi:hypothetical protein